MDYQNKLTLDRLRYFIEAAKQQHVGKAAKLLHVSPSVVSSAIKQIETELDCDLFIREKQSIRLNDEGTRLLERAETILLSVSNLKKEIQSPQTLLQGHFRLAASHYLMGQYLVPSTLKLQKNEANLSFEFCSLDTGVALAQLKAGLVDAALVFRSSYNEKMDGEVILWRGNFQVAVRRDHPILKAPIKKRPEILSRMPSIAFRTFNGPNFWEKHPALISAGINPQSAYFYDDTQTAINLLELTEGWGFMPEIIVKNSSEIVPVALSASIVAPVNISILSNGSERAKLFSQRLIRNLVFKK